MGHGQRTSSTVEITSLTLSIETIAKEEKT